MRLDSSQAVVIGSGIGGIAAAIRLSVKGYKVSVFEKNAPLGGKIAEINCEGYRFDRGPSLFTLPELVEELFVLAGESIENYLSYEQLPVITRYFWEDGTRVGAYQEPAAFARELEEQVGEPASEVMRFLKYSERIYGLTEDVFLKSSLHRWQSFLNRKALNACLQFPRLDLFRSLNRANESFFKTRHARQLFNRYATYNGSDPYRAPATLNVIPHLEHNIGAFLVKGGMMALAHALIRLAEKLGVKFHVEAAVSRILVNGKRAVGVLVGEEEIPASIVVSNADMTFTYRKLLPEIKPPLFLLQQEKSSSALIFFWGMKRQTPELDTHNILFSEDYEGEFKALFTEKTIGADPTVYLYLSCKMNAADAPPGCENWFTMVNAPHLAGQDWEELIEKTRETVCQKIERVLGFDPRDYITCERVLDPAGIERQTSSHLGALYGNSSNHRMAAFMRHANSSRKVAGLYFVGGSVHPGGGIPLCLLSAKIAVDLVK